MSFSSQRIGLLSLIILFVLSACDLDRPDDVGTAQDREALFDMIVQKTSERESWSLVKNEIYGFEPMHDMESLRAEFIAAHTEGELFYAIMKMSNARRDRHLSVSPVEGGLFAADWPEGSVVPPSQATPIRFLPDYSDLSNPQFFVSDVGVDKATAELGDILISVNGTPIEHVTESMRDWIRHSTHRGYHWKLAERLSERHFEYAESFLRDEVEYGLRRPDGSVYSVSYPYQDPSKIRLAGSGEPERKGFTMVSDVQTYDLYVHESEPVILLDWYGFREDLVTDIDSLISWAEMTNRLDYSIIVDATQSRGGSRGAYAIQHLTHKPFKTTFGNVRISDVIPMFVEQRRKEYDAKQVLDSGAAETVDDGSWQIDWLEHDVMDSVRAGAHYSNDVPFKLAHLPKDSDGILNPAERHFTGELVVLLGPKGGSHLDQFASIVSDNKLGTIIGMPGGGYSNTWEWEEVLTFPGRTRGLATFMWSIGHTIRPNGEVLEGNPADIDEYVPLTASNFLTWRDDLISGAMDLLK